MELFLLSDFDAKFHFTRFCKPFFPEQGVGRVTNLRVTNTNGRRLRIAWTGVRGATGYRVTWRQGNSKCCMSSDVFEYFEL